MTNKELALFNEGRNIVQVGYASKDAWRSIKALGETLDIEPWEVCNVSDKNSRHVKLYEKRVDEKFNFKCAHCQIGNMDFEVLAGEYGPNAYDAFIDEKGEGIQHPKEKMDKEILWDMTLDAEEAGAEVMLTGGVDIDRFVYLDMQKHSGAVYEMGNQPDMELVSVTWPSDGAPELKESNKSRLITQITYLTNDLNATMEILYKALKFGPWKVAKLDAGNTKDFKVDGKALEGGFECKIAACMIGKIQVVILEPVKGLEPLRKHLEKHGAVVASVTEKLGAEDMKKFAERMEKRGYKECVSGEIAGEKFAMFDLDDKGLSMYTVMGPEGKLNLDGIGSVVWPEE